MTYSDEILRELHDCILSALKEFDRICKKYNITYFALYGTAIGAVRHSGFIPWDDDIDVGMLRSEYDKLRKVPKSEWNEKYILVDCIDEVSYHRSFYPRLYIKNTIYEGQLHYNKLLIDGDERHPIYIDIFIYDFFNIKYKNKLIKKADFYKSLYIYSKCGIKSLKNDSFKEKTSCFLKNTTHRLLKIFHITPQAIYSKYLTFLIECSGENISRFGLATCRGRSDFISDYCEMFPVIYKKFENINLPLLKNYDKVLTADYGSYMELPPKEKQSNTPPAVLDFGDGKGNVFEAKDN